MQQIEFEPKLSPLFLLLLVISSAIFLIILTLNSNSLNVQLLLIVGIFMVIINYYFYWRYFGSSHAIVKFRKTDKNEWMLYDLAGNEYKAKILSDSLSTSFLIILNFRTINEKKRKSVIIFKDALSTETFRQLRILLQNQT